MDASLPPIPVAAATPFLDAQGVVCADVLCRKCGYNLRGLHGDGRCPECGAAVGRSTVGDLLQFSDPVWLARMARGINLILWSWLVYLLLRFRG